MTHLSIDTETYSSINLAKSGVYRYVEADDFEVMLFGYSIDGGKVEVVDIAQGETIPESITKALFDDSILKWAFNANFERVCLSKFLGLPQGQYLSPSSWRCTMIWSAYLGLPLSLEGAGAILGLEKQKLNEGKELIRYFCNPCSPTISNEGRLRNKATDDPIRWELFAAYNRRDVEVELAIQKRLSRFPVPSHIWQEYHLDQIINDRGVKIDIPFVSNAIVMDERSKKEISNRLKHITDLENPNSVMQLKEWLNDQGIEIDTLGRKDVEKSIKHSPDYIQEVLTLRLKLAKSSVRKYEAMLATVCKDGRARGMFQFYGANRTGRWAGRRVQLQNLPQNRIEDLEVARSLVESGNYDAIKLLYSNVPDTLSQLIRTAFIPESNKRLLVSDFSAIEARVIAWLANEKWRIDVFKDGGDIYCASASQMFKVPVEKNGENSHLRQKGKIAELALGYGGSVGALKAMGALELGLKEDELYPLVQAWRESNPAIVRFWWDVDKAVKKVVQEKTSISTYGIRFSYESGFLFIALPSNRRLAYVKPRIGRNKFDSPCVTYEGIGATKKWERIETYGPKIVENIVQAISRDLLSFAMNNLKDTNICMHVHDEIVVEASSELNLDDVTSTMAILPKWAKGLTLNAEGFETTFYKKD
jgi:DNA polymerase